MLALNAPLPVVAATYAVAGLASGLLNPMLGAIFFERTPRPILLWMSAPSAPRIWVQSRSHNSVTACDSRS